MSEWVSVKDRLPDEKGRYLVAFYPCQWDHVSKTALYTGIDTFRGKAAWAKRKYQKVTHWMPLPQPPEVEE